MFHLTFPFEFQTIGVKERHPLTPLFLIFCYFSHVCVKTEKSQTVLIDCIILLS